MLTLRRSFKRSSSRQGPVAGTPVANAYYHFPFVVHLTGELSDQELLKATVESGAFDFWSNPAEDVYSTEDGDPV